LSDQLDIVIHDRRYPPLLFEVGGAHFIPAESVYAVFEVKQDISKRHIKYAGDKIASVRRLDRTSVGFPTATGPAERREPQRILGGLVTLDRRLARRRNLLAKHPELLRQEVQVLVLVGRWRGRGLLRFRGGRAVICDLMPLLELRPQCLVLAFRLLAQSNSLSRIG
jgi:hypothetical protein